MTKLPAVLLAAALACGGWGAAYAAGTGTVDEATVELSRGKAALDDGLFQVAEDRLRAFLKREGPSAVQNEEALSLLAQALELQNKYAEILELMKVRRRWLLLSEDSGSFAFWRGLASLRTGDPGQALVEVERFEERFPGDAARCRVLLLRASACLALGRVSDAVGFHERFDRECPDSPDRAAHALEWGRSLVRAGRPSEAAGVFRRLGEIDAPDGVRTEGTYWLGRALADSGDAAAARGAFASVYAAADAAPDVRARAAYALAAIRADEGDLAAALEAMTNGVTLAADAGLREEGTWRVGELRLRLGQTDEGAALLRPLIAARHGSARAVAAQLAIAGSMLDAGRADEAVAEYQHYLETFDDRSGQARAYEGKGWGLLKLLRPAEAVLAFGQAATLHDDEAAIEDCLFKVGDAYFENGQFRMAHEAYGRVQERFPAGRRAVDALLQQGVCLMRLGEHRLAAETFAVVAARAAGTAVGAEAQWRGAGALEAQGNMAGAVEAYGRAIEAAGKDAGDLRVRALMGRGLALYRMFEFGRAGAEFDLVLAEFPSGEPAERALYMKGMCQYGLMQDREAVETCGKFVQMHPDSRWLADVLFWLGKYEHNRGRFDEAERLFSELASRRTGSPLAADALLWAGVSASRRKEYVRAIEYLTRMIKEHPGSPRLAEARFHQGDAMSELGLFSEAILVFDEIVARFPESPLVAAALGRKGDCQFTLGAEDPKRYEESMASYRMVADDPSARPDLVLQANYKIGRCLEKTGRVNEALDQYYVKVMLKVVEDRDKGVWHDQLSTVWFTRAAFNAADLLEARKDWRGMVGVLERVVAGGGAAADEARARIERIKTERWSLLR